MWIKQRKVFLLLCLSAVKHINMLWKSITNYTYNLTNMIITSNVQVLTVFSKCSTESQPLMHVCEHGKFLLENLILKSQVE